MLLKTDQLLAIEEFSDCGKSATVFAFAGTGKTTSLKCVGERHQGQWTFLYVPFNKAAQVDASRRMPPNVICRTFNSLGWEAEEVSRIYGFDGIANGIRLPAATIMKRLRLTEETEVTVVKETLRWYLNSTDAEISGRHVPMDAQLRFTDRKERRGFVDHIVRATTILWQLVSDPRKADWPMSHDGYMKLWYLHGGALPYCDGELQGLFLDEAQDMNPVNWALAQRWNLPTFVVGDSFQQIYAFRGAIDALQRVDFTDRFWLSQSFRFGPAVAELANGILTMSKDAPEVLLQGNTQLDSKVFQADQHQPEGKHTRLCRTNFGLMEEALKAVRAGQRIAVVGNIKDAVSRLKSAWALYNEDLKKVRHPDIRLFGEWEALEAAANDDADLKVTVQRIHQYGGQIPRICADLSASVEVEESEADVVLSTAHKAKGREWDKVVLANDFPEIIKFDEETGTWKVNHQERNLLYVAATRGIKELYINQPCVMAQMHSAIRAAA